MANMSLVNASVQRHTQNVLPAKWKSMESNKRAILAKPFRKKRAVPRAVRPAGTRPDGMGSSIIEGEWTNGFLAAHRDHSWPFTG
jgi:hypothetical protein